MSRAQVLIVDDHNAVRQGIRRILSHRPHWFVCAEAVDGMDAIAKAMQFRPDLVLMDISMPGLDGLDAARKILTALPQTRIVIVSQNDPHVARRQAEYAGAAGYVAKSALSEELIPTIERVLFGDTAPVIARTTPNEPSGPVWLSGGSAMSRLIGEFNWSETPLGPITNWPQSLKTSVNLIVNSQHPMWIGWGPNATFLYNDAYIDVLSLAKHPWALGKPAAEVWSEIWDVCGPLADKVFREGEATFVNDVRLFMNRGDYREETYYSFSYSPIRDEWGRVAGLFCPSTDVTHKVINARRLRTLSLLAADALTQKTTDDACSSAIATLAKNPDDIPFALLFLADSAKHTAYLCQQAGVTENLDRLAPVSIDLAHSPESKSIWRIEDVAKDLRSRVVSVQNLAGLPTGPAQQALSQAIVLPVASHGELRLIGVLVAGINPTRLLDADYRTFYDLVAGQIATAIQNTRAIEEERNRIESLAELDRAKTAFFSNISHEFRTPLALMLGPVEDLLARSHTDLSPAAKSQLDMVNRNGARLLRLVNTLLDFSRIEAGRIDARYQPTDLGSLTTELASGFRSATDKAGLKLEVNCSELSEPVYVDQSMWEKIVLNLISNAFKFTFEGEISVSLRDAGDKVELEVRDTGVGIPSEEIPRLFDRFHRVATSRSRTHEGSGIGLALVQELTKLHGGTVRVESVLGEGTAFLVSIPKGRTHLPDDRVTTGHTASAAASFASPYVEEALRWLPKYDRDVAAQIVVEDSSPVLDLPNSGDAGSADSRPRIVFADDNVDMRLYVTRLLASRYQVTAVPDGSKALESIRQVRPDLLLSDVMMPNLDGFGLVRELRSNPATNTLPIILLSARAGEEARVEGVQQGADDYLTKPFTARELLARIQTQLGLAKIREESHAAVTQRKAQFETLFNQSPLGIYLVGPDFRIREANPQASEVFAGIENVIGRDFGEVLHLLRNQKTADAVEGRFRHTLNTGEPYFIPESVQERPDTGAREYYEWQINQIPLPDGTNGVVCYFRDISRQVLARETIAKSEKQLGEALQQATAATAKFQAMFEQTPVIAGIASTEGVLLEVNRFCLDLCGYHSDQLVGEFLWDAAWWRNVPEARGKIKKAAAQALNGTPYREILNYRWADGTERLVDFALHPISNTEGKVIFLHPTGVDITETTQAAENYRQLAESLDAEVRERTKELERQNSEVRNQTAQLRELSHRLIRTQDDERRRLARELHDSAGQMIAALSMNLKSLTEKSRSIDRTLERIAEESLTLTDNLSKEIRTTSYLLHPPLLEEIGISQALDWFIRGLEQRSGIAITLSISPNFGRLPADLELTIFRIVQECLTNVHRHSGSGVANILIERAPTEVRVVIKDRGKGIPREKLENIRSHGAGVGLSGMRERLNHLHGNFVIESSDAGTIVTATIPFIHTPPEAMKSQTQACSPEAL